MSKCNWKKELGIILSGLCVSVANNRASGWRLEARAWNAKRTQLGGRNVCDWGLRIWDWGFVAGAWNAKRSQFAGVVEVAGNVKDAGRPGSALSNEPNLRVLGAENEGRRGNEAKLGSELRAAGAAASATGGPGLVTTKTGIFALALVVSAV